MPSHDWRATCARVAFLLIVFRPPLAHAVDAPAPPQPDAAVPAPVEAAPADPVAPAEEPAPLSAEEQAALATALGQDATATAPAIPDLSKVNLGAVLPGVQSLNPDISVITNLALAAFTPFGTDPGTATEAPLQTGGHDPARNGFTLQNLELSMGASVDPFLRFDTNIVFGAEVEVEEAYATTLNMPANLQARAGVFLSRFGRANSTHPHTWEFLDQPLANGTFLGGDGHRGLGLEASWLAPLPWFVTVIGSVQQPAGVCCAATYAPDDDDTVREPIDLIGTAALEQFFPVSDDLSLLVGVSGQAGPVHALDGGAVLPWTLRGGRAELFGTDLSLRYRPLVSDTRWSVDLSGEAFVRRRHGGGLVAPIVDGGGYGQLVWHIDQSWFTGLRYDLVLPRADLVQTDFGEQVQRGALLLGYAPTHFSRLRVQTSVGTRGTGGAVVALMFGLEVAIGAHGAHAY